MLRPILSAALAALLFPLAAQAADAPKVLKKVPPEFPGEAVRKGVTEGVLKASLSIDDKGSVDATPPKAKIFTSAAVDALKQWKFEANGKAQSMELKLVFSQD